MQGLLFRTGLNQLVLAIPLWALQIGLVNRHIWIIFSKSSCHKSAVSIQFNAQISELNHLVTHCRSIDLMSMPSSHLTLWRRMSCSGMTDLIAQTKTESTYKPLPFSPRNPSTIALVHADPNSPSSDLFKRAQSMLR